jgi:hypothetical protein
VLEQPVLVELDDDHLVDRHDLDDIALEDIDLVAQHVPDLGHAGPADGDDHRVLLTVEEHQL